MTNANVVTANLEARATKSRQRQRIANRVLVYAVLVFFAILFLAPVYTMFLTALKTMPEIQQGNLFALPQNPSFQAFGHVWSEACISVRCTGLRGNVLNSFLMVIPAVLISVSLGALNGYVLTKWRFKYDNLIFGIILFGSFIPFQIVLIPMAFTLGKLHLAGSISGLVLVHVVYGLAFTTLFFRNYFVTVPDDIIKAAKVDGAGFWMTFYRILLPISWPIIMVAVIWQFTGIWNDFLFGVAFTGGENQPLTVALNNLVNTTTGTKAYNQDMAAAMIAAIPTLVVYVFAGKFFVRGLMAGSVKG
ncbi:MAG: carbohydrate ABC transporter permease [Thiolinea sp.]